MESGTSAMDYGESWAVAVWLSRGRAIFSSRNRAAEATFSSCNSAIGATFSSCSRAAPLSLVESRDTTTVALEWRTSHYTITNKMEGVPERIENLA